MVLDENCFQTQIELLLFCMGLLEHQQSFCNINHKLENPPITQHICLSYFVFYPFSIPSLERDIIMNEEKK